MSAPDAIQDCLQRFHTYRDKRALAQAFSALRAEFVGPVARFLREPPSSPTVEQVLSDVLVDLLGLVRSNPPRAMAPPAHTNPAAWRRLVLLNALRDRSRRSKVYEKALAAQIDGGAPQPPIQDELVDHRKQRARVVALLPKLDVRRRVAMAMELGVQFPLSWIEELANELCVSWSEMMSRVRRFESTPQVEEAKLQVLYGPSYAPKTTRDAYRQTVSRAAADLKAFLAERTQ